MKRNLLRGSIAVAWLALGALIFITSRGHSLLVDNRNVEAPFLEAPRELRFSLNGGKMTDFYRGDRDRFTLAGSRHRIRIEFPGGGDPFEGEFVLPIKDDMYLLSLPKLLAGMEDAVEVFRSAPERRSAEEEPPDVSEEPGEGIM
ncbi:MAG: hypothetical protein LBD37_06275 [Treponema sp.]|jgi:hypothetical protein|nr:hypothetical protein [Treponema sp.]